MESDEEMDLIIEELLLQEEEEAKRLGGTGKISQ